MATTGRPSSPPSRTATSNGISASSGTPSRSASAFAPPEPKIGTFAPVASANQAMFSTTPRILAPVFSNISAARRASISAISCGVETMTTPSSFSRCTRVSWMSPVPGGRSMTSTSAGSCAVPQLEFIRLRSADDAIGPRQMLAAPFSTMKPIDITLIPQASRGFSRLSKSNVGSPSTPSMVGAEGP